MNLTFITIDDITDNILNPLDKHIEYANAYLTDKAYSFNLVVDEIRFPPSNRVKRLGALLACRECALDMVGSDTTVMTEKGRKISICKNTNFTMSLYRIWKANSVLKILPQMM